MAGFLGRLFGAVVALAVAATPAVAADLRVVSFGDSLSDVGNTFELSDGSVPPAPYWRGRFSDGRVWTEILAGGAMRRASAAIDNARDTNIAFGGARVGPDPRGLVPAIDQQIAYYLANGGRFAPTDVVTLVGGANDLLPLKSTAGTSTVDSAARRAADALGSRLTLLLTSGAKIVVVGTMPPLDLTPRARATPGQAKVYGRATRTFNTRLAQRVAAARTAFPTARIEVLDLAGLLRGVAANPAVFGFTDATRSCLSVPACAAGGPEVRAGYLFWDDIHPTARAHAVIAFFARWELDH